jgi:hypothetical protein
VKGSPARNREGVPGQGSGTVSPLKQGRIKKSYQSLDAVRRDSGRQGVKAMYTGTLINELMMVVERTEARVHNVTPENELERWYATQHQSMLVEADLLGVA